jgi:hypothetical protein
MPSGEAMSGSPFQQANSAATDYTKLVFVFQQLMRGIATATLVRVDACTNDGGLVPTGTVDVTPLVNQVDGQGQPVPHITIYGIPYNRLQGGANAVIMDPAPGDIGVCVFASRDISSVKATKAQANPASSRVFDYADGLYLGGFLNGTPTQYARFSSAGLELVSPTKITLQAPEIDLVGAVHQSGGSSTFASPLAVQGTDVHTHVHGGVTRGGALTDPPT